MKPHFILFVADQMKSTAFYSTVLGASPSMVAPGMTEFTLSDNSVLGLMPNAGAERLLRIKTSKEAACASRCELYLVVDDPADHHGRALAAGARELSPLSRRDWGHSAAYSLDPDGHVLAFAQPL